MLLIGCIARRTRLTDFGVTARLTARPGCIARRTARGTNMREKNPMAGVFVANPRLVNATVRITARATSDSDAYRVDGDDVVVCRHGHYYS